MPQYCPIQNVRTRMSVSKAYQQVNYPQMLCGSSWIFVNILHTAAEPMASWTSGRYIGSLWILMDITADPSSYLPAGRPYQPLEFCILHWMYINYVKQMIPG